MNTKRLCLSTLSMIAVALLFATGFFSVQAAENETNGAHGQTSHTQFFVYGLRGQALGEGGRLLGRNTLSENAL